jgi:uncharacterized Zn finger protein
MRPIDGIALKESDIIHVYGETIFFRGQDYFDDDRVTSVIKFKNKLTGEVEGSTTYKTDVDLSDRYIICWCNYGNCMKSNIDSEFIPIDSMIF